MSSRVVFTFLFIEKIKLYLVLQSYSGKLHVYKIKTTNTNDSDNARQRPALQTFQIDLIIETQIKKLKSQTNL